jgi:hypothetical protein
MVKLRGISNVFATINSVFPGNFTRRKHHFSILWRPHPMVTPPEPKVSQWCSRNVHSSDLMFNTHTHKHTAASTSDGYSRTEGITNGVQENFPHETLCFSNFSPPPTPPPPPILRNPSPSHIHIFQHTQHTHTHNSHSLHLPNRR